MVMISLGFACKVRESIDRFNGFRIETHFFDWIFTNFKTIAFILQHIEEPESFLTKDHFTNIGVFENNKSHYYLTHNFLKFESLHDLLVENKYYEEELDLFIEKYKRRLTRFHELILNSKEKIHFIHMFESEEQIPTVYEIYYFIMKIKEINSECNFCIHLLVAPENNKYTEKINQLHLNENVEIHYMISNPNIDARKEQRCDLNWNEIYATF